MCRIPILVLLLICTINGALGGCADYPVALAPKLLQSNKPASNILRIGAFGSFTAIPASVPLLHFAVNVINNSTDILPDTYIELYVSQLNRSSSNALLASQSLINTYNVSALIGGLYSSETRVGQLVSRIYSVPEVAATPLSTLLSNKIEYPYLARVIPPDQYEAQAIADMFEHYNWMQALVFYCDDEFGTYGMSNMVQYTKERNVTLYSSLITTGATNFSSNVAFAQGVIQTHNIKVIVVYAQAAETNYLLNQLQAVGLTGGDFIFIHTFGAALTLLMSKTTPIAPFVGGLVVTPRGGIPGAVRDKFNALWNQFGTPVPNAQSDFGSTWYYVDAVYIIAHAVENLMKSGVPFSQAKGAKLLKSISQSNFTGVTGQVVLDSTNDRLGDYVWYKIGTDGIDLSDILAVYDPITKNTDYLKTITINGKENLSDGWCLCYNGKCVNEVCVCEKGYSGPKCTIKKSDGISTTILVVIIVVPVVLFALFVGGAVKYNQFRRKKMIKDISDRQRSVIKRSDIVLKDRIGRGASGEVFRGMMRGTDVAVKKLVTSAVSSEVISDFELECAIMAGLRHPNIVLFMGSCLVPEEREMLLVMELMERGSLHDIIHNPKVQLSRDLLLHVAYQSAKGMNFLHQSCPPIIHRDLKSHNILMDDKWNARISDFGITKIKGLSNKKTKEDRHDIKQKTQSLGTIYWTAPEVFEGQTHTEASDVYSFGIVLWEMFHRQTPYGGKEPMAVVVDVSNGVRPKFSPTLDSDVRDLMIECWSGTPAARPTFEQISTRLRDMMKTNTQHFTKDAQIEAPSGTVYFVFTEVDGAGDLWDEAPMVMLKSIELHNKFIRSTMENCGGYEVDFQHNGFFVAFGTLQDAMNFCISVQKGLLHVDWPAALHKHPAAKIVMHSGLPIWSGLRVRMGLHLGVSNCEIDRNSGRTTYFGPVVDRTKKLLTATKKSYSIVTSAAIVDQFTRKGLQFSEDIVHANCGEMLDTNRSKMEGIYKVYPKSLSARENASNVTDIPHSIVMVDADDETENDNGALSSSRSTSSFKGKARAKWDIPREHLDEKEKVGRGATGDYIRCMWQGQQVSTKVLLNQKVEEADMLILKARASVLSKLQHKNLLPFYGVCMDPGNIAVVVEFMPNAGLPALLSDSSVSLNFKQKVALVRQIAEGMNYLSNNGDEWLSVFSLKSPNVLVDRTKMEIKLCDYGLGNLRDLARTMTSVGTVAWTAPEILEGDENAHSPKSTTYSFAIIMWEIMHRQQPYQDQHPIKVVSKIMGGYRPPFVVDCPSSYSQLAQSCWDADPTKRPSWASILSTLGTL